MKIIRLYWLALFLNCISLGATSEARTSSYFTVTGDRVMINLKSGYGLMREGDRDAQVLYESLMVPYENSMMGKGKKIVSGESFTLIVADRGQGQFDGTIMIYRDQGVRINSSAHQVTIEWLGERAEEIRKSWVSDSGSYTFVSFNKKLTLISDKSRFYLHFDEFASEEN